MNRPSILALSLALNIALLITVGSLRQTVSSIKPAKLEQETSVSPSGSVESASPAANELAAMDFRWTDVFDADYETYARNLRGIDCPDPMISAIVTAEVDAEFSSKLEKVLQPLSRVFWELAKPSLRGSSLREASRQLEDVSGQRSALLDRLTRFWPRALVQESRQPLLTGTDFLRAETQDAIKSINEQIGLELLDLRHSGLNPDAANLRSRELELQRRKQIEASMTPDELAEYRLRASPNASVRGGYYHTEPSSDEFAEIIRIKDDAASKGPRRQGVPTDEEWAAWKRFEQEGEDRIRELLGDERFADYQRANDTRYHAIRSATDRVDLPVETADRLFDLQVDFESQAARLREMASADDAGFADLRTRAREAVSQTLSGEALSFYERYAGAWIKQLQPKTKK